MLMGLVATITTLRLRLTGVPAHHHFILGASLGLVLLPFILAARYALDVTTAQHGWSRSDSWPLLATRMGLDRDFDVQTLAALRAAAEHNQLIGDWKFRRLALARRMFAFGLLMLIVHPLVRMALHHFGVEN